MATNSLGTLTLDLVAKIGGFTAPLEQAERQARRRGKGIADAANEASDAWSNLGKVAGLAFAGVSVAGVFTKFIAETRAAESEQAQLAAVLASTGNAAGFSQQQLNDMADSLEDVGTRSAGEINNAQTALLAFTGIVGNQFIRAQSAALDMSERTGMSIVSTAETIGRALDVPSKGLTALSRQGFRFTEDQKALVEQLEATGQVAAAQDIILRALEDTYGGAAAAARDTFDGALKGLQSTISGLLTGEGSLESATAAINAVNDALSSPVAGVALKALAGIAAATAFVLTTQLAKSAVMSATAFVSAELSAVRYQIALARTTAASQTATAALMGQSVAARSAAAAMALLGGPAGLALIAASAVMYFGLKAGESREEADSLKQAVDYLGASFDGFTKNQANAALLDVNAQLLDAQLKAIDAGDSIATLERLLKQYPDDKRAREWNESLIRARGEFDTAGQAVSTLTGKIAELNAIIEQADVEDSASAASKAYTDLSSRIEEQILLHGKSTEAARLEARINAGLVDGLLEGEAEKLVALQKERDAQIASEEAQKKREDAAKRAAQATSDAAKAISATVDGYAMQAATVGMSSRELALYKLQADGANQSQLRMADGALQEIELREQIAKAVAQQADSLREQRAVEREIEAFRQQQNLAAQGMGLGNNRREQLDAEYQIQQEYAQKRLDLEEAQRVESTRLDVEAYKQRVEALQSAESQKIDIVRESAAQRLQAEQDWALGVQESLQNYLDESGNMYAQAAEATTSVMNAATSSISEGLQGLVDGTQSASDAFANLATGMADAMLSAMADIAAQWLVHQAMEMAGIQATTAAKVSGATTAAAAEVAAIGTTTAAAAAATATTTATQAAAAATTTAAWTPAAIVSSIGSFGTAAAIGLAAVVAALAFKGFRTGGYTGGGGVDDIAGVVHGKEFVFDAAATSRIGVSNLEALRAGKTLDGAVASVRADGGVGGSGMNVHQVLNINGDVSPQTVELVKNSQRQVFEELARDAKMNGPYIQMVRSKM
ncbi:phage tail length tape measure family protein [Stutzerimonas nitrititolerans]